MDRRTITAVVLSVGIWYAWLLFKGPPEFIEEPEPVPEPVEAPASAPAPAPNRPAPTAAPSRELAFASCGMEATIHTDGGGLNHAMLPAIEGPLEITPVYTWVMAAASGGAEAWHPYADDVPPETLVTAEGQALVAGSGNPSISDRHFEVVSEGVDAITLHSVGGDGVEVSQSYRPAEGGDACTFELATTWTNRGDSATVPGQLWLGLFDALPPAGGRMAYYTSTEKAFARVDDDLEYGAWTDPEEGETYEPEPLEGPANWIALADRYHGLFVMPQDEAEGIASWARYGSGEDALDGVVWSPNVELGPGEQHTATFEVYAGTHDYEILEQVDPTLTDIVDFGMFAVFAWPLLWALRLVEGVVGNWGVAIVLVTVVMKAIFFPLNQSAFKSAEKMKQLQPLMNEIREKYADNQEEQSRRTMELFREHGANPVGGCLPMVVQMPVFLALFYVLMYSADLYHTEFLYLRDLSSPDPYCVLPAIVVGMMLIQQQFTPTGNMEPAQARMMKLMPLMFGFFWFFFPSGLVVYYFVNTGLSILQQWWIRRSFATP